MSTAMSHPPGLKGLIVAFHERLWGEGDRTVIDEMISPDAVTHWGDSDSNSIEAVRKDVDRYFAAFSDVTTRIDDAIADGDRVVVRWRTTGRHTGPYGNVAPTGRMITMAGVDIYRLEGGRIAEAWSMWDGLGTYQQLGLIDPAIGR